MAVLGDQQHTLDGGLKRFMGSDRHCGGRFANGGYPGAAPGNTQRAGNAQTPVDPGKPGVKQIE